MNTWVIILLVILTAFVFLLFTAQDKDATPEDREAAKKLGMTTKRVRLYREIFDEQVACYERGVEPPDRTSEIPNMNEWRRYGKYRESQYSIRDVYDKYKSKWHEDANN